MNVKTTEHNSLVGFLLVAWIYTTTNWFLPAFLAAYIA